MRIAYLLADQGIPYDGTKGASVHARAITGAIARLGHEVACYAARPEGAPAVPAPSRVTVHRVALDPVLAEFVKAATRGARTPGRRRRLRREIGGLCLNDPFRRMVEDDHRRQPFDILLERYSLWSLAGARLARDLALPLLLEVNAPLPEEERRFRSLELGSLARAIRRQVFREAAGIIAVSREVAEGAVRSGALPDRVAVVPNGFDPRLFRPAAPGAARRRGFTVGFLGSLKPWHGIEVLCRAFALVARAEKKARLLIVGDGPLRGRLERFAARAGLGDRIELAGSVPHHRIPALLWRFDVAVAPYADRGASYFSPLKIFEYMGAGLPIVASRIGQIAEVLSDGRTALLVPPGDAAALARATRRLMADGRLRRSLGRAAARAARGSFRWEDAALKVMCLAERALAERAPAERPQAERAEAPAKVVHGS
jgi:glycosyltransferase involved in cell wall biosynthesis